MNEKSFLYRMQQQWAAILLLLAVIALITPFLLPGENITASVSVGRITTNLVVFSLKTKGRMGLPVSVSRFDRRPQVEIRDEKDNLVHTGAFEFG